MAELFANPRYLMMIRRTGSKQAEGEREACLLGRKLLITSCEESAELARLGCTPANTFRVLLLFSIKSSGISSEMEKCFLAGRPLLSSSLNETVMRFSKHGQWLGEQEKPSSRASRHMWRWPSLAATPARENVCSVHLRRQVALGQVLVDIVPRLCWICSLPSPPLKSGDCVISKSFCFFAISSHHSLKYIC